MEYCLRMRGEEIRFWSENKFEYEMLLNAFRFANPDIKFTVTYREKNKSVSRVYKDWNQEINEIELETL